MKKIVNLFTLSVLGAFILFACNKNQKVVRQLDGEWKLTAYSVDGESESLSDIGEITYSFEKCRVKKSDCSGSMSAYDEDKGGNIAIAFDYNIEDKGEKINIKFNLLGLIEIRTGRIKEQSKTKFVYEYDEVYTTSVYNPDTQLYEDVTVTSTILETLEKN